MRPSALRFLPARLALLLLIVVAVAGSSVTSGVSAPTGLVAAYSFDAGSGSTLADSSGSANTGTISGATWTSSGKSGGALSFDGTNDLVTIADAASLDLSSKMTLEAWVRPSTQNATWRTVLLKERSGGLAYALYSSTDTGRPSGEVKTSSSRETRGPAALPPATWSHLATTYDGVALRLFVNGTQVASQPITGSISTSSYPLRIGGNNVWAEWFSGRIDDLRIYNRALTVAELQADMNTPVGGTPSPADTQAPTAPANLAASGAQTQITLAWSASTDNVGVAAYSYYRDARLVGNATGTSSTFTGLACDTSYTLAVDAYDAAGNRSARPSIAASTSACSAPADTQAPTAPSGLVPGGQTQTQTQITLSWNSSSDNVGVTGYSRYRDGSLISSGNDTSFTFASLSCGTSYTLAVEAYDSAGNRSERTSITATTSACSTASTLVAAYSFDAGSGATLADRSGKGNNGTILGATWTAAGKSGGALAFDGVDDLVTVADAASLDLAAGMTLEAWIRPTANTTWRTVVTKEMSGNLAYGLFSNSDTPQPSSIVTIGSSPVQDITRGPTEVPQSSWAHLATTYDGSVLRLYVDGTQVGTRDVTGAMANSAGPLQIGGNKVWPEWFQGQIDDLRIYSRALTAAELQADMTTPVGGATTPPPPPPPADTQAPTAPSGLAVGGQTQNGLTLTWNAASDDVGVSGYGLYRNGTLVGSTSVGTRSYGFTGLACGTSYSLGVDAFDAAGNRSGRSSVSVSTSACSPPPPPPPPPSSGSGLAQVWVDVSGGSCGRSGSAAGYVDASACGSLSAAYTAAQAGDTILVAGGSYASQSLPSGSKQVTFRSAPGAAPVFRSIGVSASNLVLDGLHVDAQRTKSLGIFVEGDNNTFRNGSVHGIVDEKGVLNGGSFSVFDNYDFYDVFVTNENVHNECIYSNGPNLTVRNSRFWACATMDLFITRGDWWDQPLYGGITLINNVFGHATMIEPDSWHYYSLGINGGVIQEMRNWTVINNTFETPASGGDTPAPGTIWANNLGDWNCYPGATFTGNVGKTCSPTDKAAPTSSYGWLNPSTNNFHLTPTSAAINAANPTHAPPTDKDGNPRNGPPDAGAYEYQP